MCGIVGALVFKNSQFSIAEPYIAKMRDTMLYYEYADSQCDKENGASRTEAYGTSAHDFI